MFILGEVKPDRESLRGNRSRCSRNDNQTSSGHVHVGDLLNRNVEVNRVKVILILRIQVSAISKTESKPAARINLDAAQRFDRIVIESVWRVTTDIRRRPDFSDRLEVLVHREVKADGREPLIRPVEQHEVAAGALRIAVQNVANVCRHVYVLVQAAIHEKNRTEVSDVATGAGAALQLVEA